MGTHWKKLKNPDYLGSWDLDGLTHLTVKIKSVKQEMIFNQQKNAKEECIIVTFVQNIKPMIFNTTNCKTMKAITNSDYIEDWQGREISIKTEKVKAFGQLHDALRVQRNVIGANSTQVAKEIKCENCENIIQGVGNYSALQVAKLNKDRYGFAICAECSKKIKNEETEKENENVETNE